MYMPVGHFGSLSLCPSLHPWQPLLLRSCCHLLSASLTLRNGTRPSHCNLSLLHCWHWDRTLITLHSSFFLSFSPTTSLHPLLIWYPDGASAGEGGFHCPTYLLQKKLTTGQMERERQQLTPSGVIFVQGCRQLNTEPLQHCVATSRFLAVIWNRKYMNMVSARQVKDFRSDFYSDPCLSGWHCCSRSNTHVQISSMICWCPRNSNVRKHKCGTARMGICVGVMVMFVLASSGKFSQWI